MQSNIIDMFSTDHTEKCLYNSLSDKIRYTVSCQDFSPVITARHVRYNKSLQIDLVDSLVNRAKNEISLLYRDDSRFMGKFEKILRIIYRLTRYNPELILILQNLMCENNREQSVCELKGNCSFLQLNSTINGVLKEQAHKDGIIQEDGGMEQLIFFMLGEVIKRFESELIFCCQDLIENRSESGFPSEEDMIKRFYKPIADQLSSLEAS